MNLGSAGYTDQEKDFFARIVEERIVKGSNLDTFGSNLKRVQNIFGTDAGSIEDVYAKVSVGGKEAITDISTTANSLAKFGAGARSVGVGDVDSLAAFIVSESQSSSPDAASEKLKSFFAQVDKRNVADGDLATIMSTIDARVKKGDSLYDVLGEQNAVLGYTDLANAPDKLRQMTEKLSGAATSGIFADQARGLDSDPTLRLADLSERRRGEREAAEQAFFAQPKALIKAIRDERATRALNEGDTTGLVFQSMDSYFRDTGFSQLINGPFADIDAAVKDINVQEFVGGRSPFSDELTNELKEYMRRSAEALEDLNDKKKSKKSTRTADNARKG